jgi:nitrite reductase (NADH) small subunit/3-phenylpropionate/trans-cinnamate dioxygenase ferredoxin subunit
MPEFHSVCKVGDVPEGEGTMVKVCGKMVALFCVNGQYHAIDDMCPHMGASLSAGYLENNVVTCPWHAWRFRITDGTWADNPRVKIGSYPVKVEGDNVLVGMDPPPPKPGSQL